jgi:hypothetical protein
MCWMIELKIRCRLVWVGFLLTFVASVISFLMTRTSKKGITFYSLVLHPVACINQYSINHHLSQPKFCECYIFYNFTLHVSASRQAIIRCSLTKLEKKVQLLNIRSVDPPSRDIHGSAVHAAKIQLKNTM